MNELKTLQEEDKEFFESHEGKLWSKAIELAFKAPFVEVAMMHILKRVSEKYFTLGMMKGVELVEGELPKYPPNSDREELVLEQIKSIINKLKQELK